MTERYNGWTNRETWNIALWMANNEELYRLAKACENYEDFVETLAERGEHCTPFDRVSYTDPKVNAEELNKMMRTDF